MFDPSLLSDLFALSLQAASIAAIGGLIPSALRLQAPGVRYTWFRLLLLVCLALPLVQGRPTGAVPQVTTTVAVSGVVEARSPVPTPIDAFPWLSLIGAILVGGIAFRGVWIAVGLLRLRRLRTVGRPDPSDSIQWEVQQLLRTRADIRYVAGIQQPITFGVQRPLVLLPDGLRSYPAHIRRAVVTHELLHVQRRDWIWLLLEESLRAVLWFHPGIWWLVSRVQLAREEVVDELAVLATGARRAYVEALAAFADEAPLVPAAAFARRRHLFRRMSLISREAHMSSRRVAFSCAVMALVVCSGGWYAINAFPLLPVAPQNVLTEIGPLERQAKPTTPENPIPRRIFSVDPLYPPETPADVNALVMLVLTLDQYGRVAEIRRLGVTPFPQPNVVADEPTLAAFVRSAADAVRQWRYDSPTDAPVSLQVIFRFSAGQKPELVAHSSASDGQRMRLAEATAEFMRQALQGRQGGPATVGPNAGARSPSPPWAADAIRVGGNVRQPAKTKHVNPIYPAEAREAKVQGVVILEARIGPDGGVTNARVLRSIPLLDQAALDAVLQWEFTPTLLNGQPVPILLTVTVQFTLG